MRLSNTGDFKGQRPLPSALSQLDFRMSRWALAHGSREEPDASACRLIQTTLVFRCDDALGGRGAAKRCGLVFVTIVVVLVAQLAAVGFPVDFDRHSAVQTFDVGDRGRGVAGRQEA